ncbi:hypothetical protein GCM10027060_17400 [Nesterenkonia halophila]|uniref:DUF6807 family protein n=1 Tax=Nesterenkonia halophila TaxID=302044 RepID=UPI001291E677|nr:DUF6807 family protein [Nesterenkonia halophila]
MTDDVDDAPRSPTSVLLVGLDGFGRQHLANLERLAACGRAELIAGASLTDPGPEVRGNIPVHATLGEARKAGHRPDVVIISTPINTHFDLAREAMDMGADVLLEKPPTATLAQHRELLAHAEAAGRRVQVGFQSIGSHALAAIEQLLAAPQAPGGIGELRAVSATGLWLRRQAYYDRAPWAGRRVLDGVEVVDGVVTNPLAHAVRTALHVAGARRAADVDDVAVELHHAHRIEADDTSIVRLRTASGLPVTAALTLCAPEDQEQDPWVTVHGTEGQAVLYYTRDELVIAPNREAPQNADDAGEPRTVVHGRTDLLENLLDVREGAAAALLSPLADADAFMQVLEAVRTADEPATIAEEHLVQVDSGPERHPVIPHVADYLARATKAPSTFSSLGAPWAASPATDGELRLGEQTLATLRTGEDVSPTDSPRPFLDRVRTRGGVVVTDQQPLDHTWHLGVSAALQDVDGTNFWGGRTYTRDAGRYIWREDHGRIRAAEQRLEHDVAALGGGSRLDQRLEWLDHRGTALLAEERAVAVAGLDADSAGADDAWALDLSFALTSAVERTVMLGSPGSNGRVGGGYGGFFWRLPAVEDATICTAEAEGEEAVHGSVTDWLMYSGRFGSEHGGGEATLVLASTDADPWFVRCSGYPGVGMSLAWDAPVAAEPGREVARRVRVAVVDGRLDRDRAAALGERLISEPAAAPAEERA